MRMMFFTKPRMYLRKDPDAGWTLALWKLRVLFNVRRTGAEAMSDRRCKRPDHCLNPVWCTTFGRCMRDSEPEIIRPTITRPEPDCRTCASYGPFYGRCNLVSPRCTNGDHYAPLPPVRLWRKA